MRLIANISVTGRNITFDNWFASIPLIEKLRKEHRLTAVCTLHKNKREIPPAFLQLRNRAEKSSLFGVQHDLTLLFYVPRKGKNVLLLSSLHHDNKLDLATGVDQKPEIISFYNFTKAGVHVVDELSATYNVSRNSRRWSLTIFLCLSQHGGN